MTLSLRFASLIALLAASFVALPSGAGAEDQWVTYEGREGPGKGKSIVFVSGDDEYRSEEACPQLAKILAERHGFKCTVLFAIDPATGEIKPDHQTNIPGTHLLNDADLMVMFTRFRNLPDEQMKPIIDFTNSGKPIIGLRTATHGFNINAKSAYAKYTWTSKDPAGGWGQLVLGDTWISHHGHHGKESTRGAINPEKASHPVLRGVTDIWGPTDVYGIIHLPADAEVLVHGQILTGMKPTDPPLEGAKNNPMMPLVWTKSFKGDSGKTSRVLCTTMGASVDLESEGLRRLLVNGVYWGLGMESQIPEKANVDLVGEYKPTFFGFGKYVKGLTPASFR